MQPRFNQASSSYSLDIFCPLTHTHTHTHTRTQPHPYVCTILLLHQYGLSLWCDKHTGYAVWFCAAKASMFFWETCCILQLSRCGTTRKHMFSYQRCGQASLIQHHLYWLCAVAAGFALVNEVYYNQDFHFQNISEVIILGVCFDIARYASYCNPNESRTLKERGKREHGVPWEEEAVFTTQRACKVHISSLDRPGHVQ